MTDHKHAMPAAPTVPTRTRLRSVSIASGATGFFANADLSTIGSALIHQDGNSGCAMVQYYRAGSFNQVLGIGTSAWEFRGGTFSAGSAGVSVFLESGSAGARLAIKNNLGFDTSFTLFDWTIAADLA